MARNQVQFQKGLSEASFAEIYGTEEQCHAGSSKGAGQTGSNVLGAMALITASSRGRASFIPV